MTDDLVKDAREALAGVTEGPWHVTECGDYWVEHKQPLANAAGFRGVALCGDMGWPNADAEQCEWEANARFIASARSLVPAMADRIQELEAQLKTVCQREAETIARYDARIEALQAENARLRKLLAEADRWIAWKRNGFASDFAEDVQAAIAEEAPQ